MRAREERAGGGGEGRGCPYLRRGCCHCGHLSEEVAAATLVARPGKKPPMKAGETQIRKKQVVQESPMGQVLERIQKLILALQGILVVHQSCPQMRVQQHTAESKERITECTDEEIVDAPVPHQSQEILGASSELLQTTIDDLVQEKAVKETAEEGGGGHGRNRSTSPATELWNIWRTCVGLQAKRAMCERQRYLRGEAVCRGHATRATWMKKSVTRNVASNA